MGKENYKPKKVDNLGVFVCRGEDSKHCELLGKNGLPKRLQFVKKYFNLPDNTVRLHREVQTAQRDSERTGEPIVRTTKCEDCETCIEIHALDGKQIDLIHDVTGDN